MASNHTRQVSDRTDRPGLRRRSAGGFTLIEVLVVVAIIALLVSILLPSLQRAREQAKRLLCATNLRTISQAMNIYCFMYKDYFPWEAGPPCGGDLTDTVGPQPWEQFYKVVQKGTPRVITAAELKERCPFLNATDMPDINNKPPNFVLDWYVCAKDKYNHTTGEGICVNNQK